MTISRALLFSSIVAASLGVVAARTTAPLTLSCDAFAPTASLKSLQVAFGSADVGTDSLAHGRTDGEMIPASVLFPHDPRRRIAIAWKDTVAKSGPHFVEIPRGPTEWKTPEGITIGTSLRELERINGRPFHLAGFAFDEAAVVTSWDGGTLTSRSSGSCKLWISVDSLAPLDSSGTRWYNQVIGDRDFSSGNPAMQALNPRVSVLLLQYR